MNIVDNFAIVNWVFSQDEAPSFTRSHVWEILKKLIDRTLASERALLREQSALQKKIEESERIDNAEEAERLRDELSDVTDNVIAASRQKKQLFLVIFQRFSISIGNSLTRSAADPKSEDTAASESVTKGNGVTAENWFGTIAGYLLAMGRRYCAELAPLLETLAQNFFSDDVDPRLLDLFKQIKGLAEAAAHYRCEKSE